MSETSNQLNFFFKLVVALLETWENLSLGVCKQQRHRLVCSFVQSDQHLLWYCIIVKLNTRLQLMVHHCKYPLFDLYLGPSSPKTLSSTSHYPLHYGTYAWVAVSNGLGNVNDLWPWPKVTHKVAQYPLHHGTYAQRGLKWLSPTALEMHLQENTLFDLCHCGQGHTKCCPVSSTSCDLKRCKV